MCVETELECQKLKKAKTKIMNPKSWEKRLYFYLVKAGIGRKKERQGWGWVWRVGGIKMTTGLKISI